MLHRGLWLSFFCLIIFIDHYNRISFSCLMLWEKYILLFLWLERVIGFETITIFFFFFFFVQIPNERFEIIPLYLLEQIKFLSLTKMIKSQCLETEKSHLIKLWKILVQRLDITIFIKSLGANPTKWSNTL